ncbi:hypothetical protein Ocin01_01469 [Orchesella cincta]|uniref:E3 ubiquitin-protein ligase APD1-4 middle domain-containing protein n=1 Tax=Orchesella cincta TaxID=48709 RepID=A0A1D2NIX1_ORCCI|nr:hypothetical protein Ocin01_01469 [Orchesella cincta]
MDSSRGGGIQANKIASSGTAARFTGPIRVATFCLMTIILPCLLLIAPLYIRYQVFSDVLYTLGESDLVTVDRPISTFWCEKQDLWMNATFHAYLLDEQPQISEDLQLFEMDKHMQLADDSLEYWGFFLLQGSKVILSVCSRQVQTLQYDGARLMVVKGNKNLKHCALLDPSPNPDQVEPWEDDKSAQGGEITVTFRKGEQDVERELDSYEYSDDPLGGKSPGTPAEDGLNQTSLPQRTKSRKNKLKFVGKGAGRLRDRYQKGVQTAHESMKIHRNRNRSNNTRIFDAPPYGSDGGAQQPVRRKRNAGKVDHVGMEKGDENMSKFQDSQETNLEDAPPNPVGVEPDEMEVHGEGDEEVIDEEDIRSSGSSFAKNLWSCYGGDTLFTQTFSSSLRCQSQDAMMKYALRMRTVHEITSTGYYYYIFYSDNDIVSNDIFARFNIEKVVYSFPNYTHSCINTTQCSLPLNFLSSEKVLLEVPLQDGVSDEDSLSQMILISSCRPRLAVFFIFPVSIIFLILCCAFM